MLFSGICLSDFFPHDIKKKPVQLGSSNLTLKYSTMSPGNPFILGSKGQWSWVTRNLSVFSHNEMLPLAAYESHAGFPVLQHSAAQAKVVTLGFLCITRNTQTAGFSMHVVSPSQSVTETLPAWVMALIWVLAAYLNGNKAQLFWLHYWCNEVNNFLVLKPIKGDYICVARMQRAYWQSLLFRGAWKWLMHPRPPCQK